MSAPANFLLSHFDRLAEAPGGIAKLRALLLQLGVQGKLTQQDSADTPATAIISHFRKPKHPFAPISADELPFQIPSTWVWSRLGACMELFNGRAFKPTDWSTQGLPIVRIKNLNNESAPFNYCATAVEDRHLVANDDFLISWSGTPGTSFGAFIWKRGKAVLNQHIFRAELSSPELYKPYLRLAVNSRLDELIEKAHGGVGLQHVTKPTLERLPLPLPPLAEQRRIVAKVEELMGLCDALEAAQQEREAVRTRLRTSALHQLASPDSDFKSAAFVLQNLPRLTAEPEDLADIQQSVLQLAIQGRLVPSDTEKSSSVPKSEDEPFSVPYSWSWEPISTVGQTQTGSTPPTAERDHYAGEIPFIKPAAISEARGEVVYTGEGLTKSGANESTLVEAGAVLMVCIGGSIGKAAVIDRPACFNQQINSVTPRRGVDSHYVLLAMRSPYFRSCVLDTAAQGTLPIISKGKWERLKIPLPPLAEQRRIVAKVDELMAVLDALETALTSARTTAASLLAVTIVQFHAP